MNRRVLKRAIGDAMHAIRCAAGYHIRWLMRAFLAQAAKAREGGFFGSLRTGYI